MTNVIPLKPPTEEEPKIWTCGECGCQSFKAAEALAFGEKPLETDDLPEDAA